jgi:hypothetical protein
VPDAIAEALAEEFNEDAVLQACEQLATGLVADRPLEFSDVELAVLEDCCDGTTWFANSDQWPAHERATWFRVADRLETKLGVDIPRM